MPDEKRYLRDDIMFGRAVTFFDAIFAFSVTLLITTVDDFSPEAWSSFDALMESNGASLLAFAISFVVVVSFWRANHEQVTSFKALDSTLLTLNCMVMFGVVLIPFATEALGKLGNLPLPVAVYAVVISVTYLVQITLIRVADRRGLSGTPPRTSLERRWELISTAMLPLVFLGSIPVAYAVSPSAAEGCWLILIVLMPLLGRLEKSSLDKVRAAGTLPARSSGEGA